MSLPATTAPTRNLHIDFLFLDLSTRCRATDATLLEAIERTRPALDAVGVTVSVTQTLVASEAQAQALGFVSSPTIRINDVDIAGELVESACDSYSETCACNGGVDCRDWVWQGQRSHEPPPPGSGLVPANLREYFAATAADIPAADCCTVEDQAGCCDHEDKAACCGVGVAAAGCGFDLEP
jgi:Domain of unknown function (DUF2703)